MSNIDPPKKTTQKTNQMSNIDPSQKNKKQKTHTTQKTNKMSNIDPPKTKQIKQHRKLTT
jgi:hypothetical protein